MELKENFERLKEAPRHLYFHGTGHSREEFIRDHGLLAARAFTGRPADSLTTTLETAGRWARIKGLTEQPIITFWYPNKNEIRRYKNGLIEPTLPIPDETKTELTADLMGSSLDEASKRLAIDFISQAVSYLPPSRLGAVGFLTEQAEKKLEELRGYCNEKGIEVVADRVEITKRMKDIFSNINFSYVASGRGIETIIQDAVKSIIEHQLLYTGNSIKHALSGMREGFKLNADSEFLRKEREGLERVTFDELNFERYRKILIKKIDNFLSQAS